MWSPGFLLLLLGSACLTVLSDPPDTSHDADQESQEEEKGFMKRILQWVKKNPRKSTQLVVDILEITPLSSPLGKVIKTGMDLFPVRKAEIEDVAGQIRALDVKLDIYRAEMKWDTGAGGAFQMTVNNIEEAWTKYSQLKSSFQKSEKRVALENMFFTFYNQHADDTLVLHQLLTAGSDSLTENLGDVLAAKLRCHEKDITDQFLYLNKLIRKGDILNDKYYNFKDANTEDRDSIAKRMASESASALVQSYHRCISGSAPYIERDVFELIDETKKHQEIANTVKDYLDKTYDRYDWMVFAFTAFYSKGRTYLLKRHVFSGFTEVKKGSVSVAVAKQVKGSYTNAYVVKDAIKECLSDQILCENIPNELKKCKKKVSGKMLSETYTAVHAFKINSQTATSAVDEGSQCLSIESSNPDDIMLADGTSEAPNVLISECGKVLGKYMVFIKSDEEINDVDPCEKIKCDNGGKCVKVSGTSVGVCECKYPFYGKHCKKSLDKYKGGLLKESTEVRPLSSFCGFLYAEEEEECDEFM